jgi:penicillin-binding protein, 1A family
MAPRGKSDRRVEPSFEGSRDSSDFRIDADERIVGNGRPVKRAPKQASEEPAPRSRGKKTRRARKSGGLFGPIRRLIYWCFVLGIWAGIGVGGLVLYYGAQMPAASTWAIPDRPPNMKITAIDGSVIASRGSTGGEALALEEMSPYLPQAVIAIEDRRFYSHFGVDPFGLARAFVNNLTGQPIQGGSTITQQLAKNLFLSPERTFERKIQEVLLSFWLETKFTKEQILAMYLNRVFFGSNAYGVEAASRRYFNKSARDVNLGEAATLAGLLKAPSRLSPARDPEAAEARAQVVLGAMREEGFVTDSDLKTAMSQPPAKAKSYWSGAQHYAADMVMDEVKTLIGEPKADVVVETTIDLRLEEAAEKALNTILTKEGAKLNASQAALVSVDATGAIRAVVGGRDYAQSQFNRAAKAKRQPGSAFKPFVYAAALEAGALPDTLMNDAPVKIGNWSPENYDQKFRGPVTIVSALAQSLNTVAAQLANQVGPDKVVSLAHRLGIDSEIQPNASIALGTSEVSLVELTASYAAFMNGGYKATPHIVKRISDMDGKVLYEADYTNPPRVLSEPVAATMNSMMNRVINEGTGKAARIDGWQAAGKSGTTQSFRDALFVGYTSIMTTGIWFGNDDGAYMKKVTGGGLPARAWKDYMTVAMKGYSPTPLFGTGRSLELPPPAPVEQQPEQSIGDFLSGILPGGGTRRNEPAPDEYPPAPPRPVQDSASIEPPVSRNRAAPAPAPVYPDEPAYQARPEPSYRRTYGDVVPPADVGGRRDYREYRGPYDAPVPVAPAGARRGPIPPGEVGVVDNYPEGRRTTLFDILMGE